MRKSLIFWILLFWAALWASDGMAKPAVPHLEDGAWVLPANDASAAPLAAAQGGGYEQAIYDACARHGCDGATLVRVAGCESGFNPSAVGANGEIGLFQFMPDTYYAHGGTDIWNPWEQIEIAASMWSQGLGYHWVCQ